MKLKWHWAIFGGRWTGRVQNHVKVGPFELKVYKVGKEWRWIIYTPQQWGICRGRIEAQEYAETELRRLLETTLNELNSTHNEEEG